MSELLIGCGNHRQKVLKLPDGPDTWQDLVTLDIDPNCGADIEWDLGRLLREPLPGESRFGEIHAYHVLEHTGQQGDYRWFFAQWADFWRLLKPGGHFFGIVPAPGSVWVWGDPGHTRFFAPELLTYLDQEQYRLQVGRTAFADYRHLWRADFELITGGLVPDDPDQFFFVLKAHKPSRVSAAE